MKPAGVIAAIALCLGWAGPASALPYLEVEQPAAPPRGVVLLLHGGGWSAAGVPATATTHAAVDRFRKLGYATVNSDYRPGHDGIEDALAAYDEMVRRFPGLNTCTYGESSGGHLALMVAHARPAVTCVLGAAAPTDLPALATGDARPRRVYDMAVRAFGTDALWELSPLRLRDQIGARMLLAYGTGDAFVPVSQGRRMAGENPRAWLVRLGHGSRHWVHGGVSDRSWKRYRRLERTMLRLALG